MLDPSHPIAKLIKEDRHYKLEAYAFIVEALNYAHNVLEMGSEQPTEIEEAAPESTEPTKRSERHLSGQQLCEAVRLYALEQYGYMAKDVLASWGVRATADLGEIVFNLVNIGEFRKTKNDSRSDFDNVFDFDEGLRQQFEIKRPEA